MLPLKVIQSKTIVLPAANIDTDQIYPARYLTTTTKEGLGNLLFADWRYLADGTPNPTFVLNSPDAIGASILVAGPNFGTGSSREHAAWALLDYGIRAVISTEFADIFRANCLKNGLLPIAVANDICSWLLSHSGVDLSVDLERTEVSLPTGEKVPFAIDGFARYCLLNGVDELGFLQSHLPDIERFEANRDDWSRKIPCNEDRSAVIDTVKVVPTELEVHRSEASEQLVLVFECASCGHERRVHPNSLVELSGLDAKYEAIEDWVHCSNCGKKSCRVRATKLEVPEKR